MKKIISIVLLAAVVIGIFAGCSNTPATTTTTKPSQTTTTTGSSDPGTTTTTTTATPVKEPIDIRIGGLTGPTSIGMIKMMEDAENGEAGNNYIFTIAGAADEITPLLIQGKLDAAAVPANLASVLYNKTEGKIVIVAINTLGVLYIVEKGGDTVSSVEDLKGKTIYCTGKGSTPEYNIRYILSSNNIDPDKDVTLEFKSEPSEIVAILNQQESGVAMLPQPYVTVASGKVEGLHIALDLTEEWEKINPDTALVTGVMVMRREFIEEHPEEVAVMLEEYAKSAEFVNAYVEEAAALVEKFNIFKAAVAQKAIPYCNIAFYSGSDMHKLVEAYLKVLFDQNPASVGGKMPESDFYYGE